MRQVLLNSKGALLARMPRPCVESHCVLVAVKYSMISPGTELAGLRQSQVSAATTSLQKVKSQSSLAVKYLAKAAQHPRKALRRARQWASQEWQQRMAAPQGTAQREIAWQDNLTWSGVGAQHFKLTPLGLELTTDHSTAGYQAMTAPIDVSKNHTPLLEIRGMLREGKISIGLLNADRSAWLGHKIITPGDIDEQIVFPAEDNAQVTVVIANVEGGISDLQLHSTKMAMLAPDEAGLPHSEQGDTGWNVGYSAVGQIMAVGANVQGLAMGDWVACAGAGRANHADYISVPQNLVCKVPQGCDLKAAASATLGTIALQGVRRADPKLGETIVVIGLGLLGQLTAQMLRANGCQVIGMDVSEERVKRALTLDMFAGATREDLLRNLVRDLTQGQGADATVITAATSSNEVVNLAMAITRRKGRVVIVGDVGLGVHRQDFYRKEIDLLMSTSYGPGRYDPAYEEQGLDYPYAYVRWTSNRNMQAYLNLIKNQAIDVMPLIERIVPIDQAPQIYQELARQSTSLPLGVLLEYSPDLRSLPDLPEATLVHVRGHRKNKSEPINYVLVGAGAFGTSMLVPQLEKMPEQFFLRGVVSRDNVRGGNYARQQSLEFHSSDLAPVLENPDVQLLVIATRHDEHANQVIAGLKAGKSIFVEKPLALNWDQLNAIYETYTHLENPPLLMVGFNRRFSPAMQLLKEHIQHRRSPLMIHYRLNGGYISPEHWIQTAEGGGRNLGEACHMYDCFRFLTDAPVVDIQASSINPGSLPYLRNDNFVATLSYEEGSVGTLTYTALGPKQGLPKERIEVFCDGDAFIIDDYRCLIRASDGAVLWSGETDKGHFTELERLGQCLKSGDSSLISFDEIIETTAVCICIEDLLYGKADDETIE